MNQIESTKMYSDFIKEVNQLFDSRNIKRKYINEPYWKHLERVTKIVEDYINIDISMWTKEHMSFHSCLRFIAYGHDVFEDIDKSYQFRCFNKHSNPAECVGIYSGIRHLTNQFTKERYSYLDRKQRKILEANRLSKIPLFALYIKLADIMDNTSNIMQHDLEFAAKYLEEKSLFFKLTRSHNWIIINSALFRECEKQVEDSKKQIK